MARVSIHIYGTHTSHRNTCRHMATYGITHTCMYPCAPSKEMTQMHACLSSIFTLMVYTMFIICIQPCLCTCHVCFIPCMCRFTYTHEDAASHSGPCALHKMYFIPCMCRFIYMSSGPHVHVCTHVHAHTLLGSFCCQWWRRLLISISYFH